MNAGKDSMTGTGRQGVTEVLRPTGRRPHDRGSGYDVTTSWHAVREESLANHAEARRLFGALLVYVGCFGGEN
jgi:hypothetical protein